MERRASTIYIRKSRKGNKRRIRKGLLLLQLVRNKGVRKVKRLNLHHLSTVKHPLTQIKERKSLKSLKRT